jgi:hypothetical protein
MKHIFKRLKINHSRKAVSNVVSTIILTGILLTIFVVAMFVSTNILNAQLTSTEFNQAQSNMQLLDSTIQDVSLRSGAGGFVQFNEREGGIGVASTNDTVTLQVQDANHKLAYGNTTNPLVQLSYRGGTQASAAVDPTTGYTTLSGSPNTYVDLTTGLGWLRLAQDNGGKIKLDYNRFRIASAGLIDNQTNLVQVTFIRLVKGDITASTGTVSVSVQNTKTTSTTWTFESPTVNLTIQQNSDAAQTWTSPAKGVRTVVVVSEIQVEVALR